MNNARIRRRPIPPAVAPLPGETPTIRPAVRPRGAPLVDRSDSCRQRRSRKQRWSRHRHARHEAIAQDQHVPPSPALGMVRRGAGRQEPQPAPRRARDAAGRWPRSVAIAARASSPSSAVTGSIEETGRFRAATTNRRYSSTRRRFPSIPSWPAYATSGLTRNTSDATSIPLISTRPDVGRISVARILRSVVRPLPRGPTIARLSPGPTSRSTPASAVVAPKAFATRLTAIIARSRPGEAAASRSFDPRYVRRCARP